MRIETKLGGSIEFEPVDHLTKSLSVEWGMSIHGDEKELAHLIIGPDDARAIAEHLLTLAEQMEAGIEIDESDPPNLKGTSHAQARTSRINDVRTI